MSLLVAMSMLGGLVLFLYGINALGDGLKRLSGNKMEAILGQLTSNKWKACLLGLIVTAVIQSSGATTVMVVGFVNSELMNLSQAVGVILGANVGTTVTSWILSLTGIRSSNIFLAMLKPENFSPVVGIIGLAMTMAGKKEKHKQIGSILTAFAVLMIGMDLMSSSAKPLTSNPAFISILTIFANPVFGFVAGLIVTVILQSSSASVGILQAISMGGSLTWSSALPILMGENVGSAITGILASIGASRNARRTSLMQLLFCLLKTLLFMAVFYAVHAVVHFAFMDTKATPFTIALFHTAFNVIAVLATLPVSDLLVRLVEKVLPVTEAEKEKSDQKAQLKLLDARFAVSPAYALTQARQAAESMANYTRDALFTAAELLDVYDDEKAKRVSDLESIVDEYDDTLNSYLVKISGLNYSRDDSHTLSDIMHCIGDFERIADHAYNIMQAAQEIRDKDLDFSGKTKEEMQIFAAAVKDITDQAVTVFNTSNFGAAKMIEPLEEVIDAINVEAKKRHIKRLRKGKWPVELGFVLADMGTDFERIADHCSNIALCLMQVEEDGYDTHGYLERFWNNENPAFQELMLHYTDKYALPRGKKGSVSDAAEDE